MITASSLATRRSALARGPAIAVSASERGSRVALVVALLLTLALRLPFVSIPLSSDEGGFLMVARQWHAGGRWLYGNQWVDRPPLLIVIFKLASLFGDAVAVRGVALVLALAAVVAAWRAGRTVGGSRGAALASLTAAAILSSVQLSGERATGEGFACAFVLVSVAMTLTASEGRHRAAVEQRLVFAAGIVGSVAILVKQNFADGLIFAFVLLALRRTGRRRNLVAVVAGAAVPVVLTAVWATVYGPGLRALWQAVFVFRGQALSVVLAHSVVSPLGRLHLLLLLFVVSGELFLVIHTVRGCAAARRDRPALAAAILVTLTYELVSIALGASWWKHYLLQLAPMLALGTALAVRHIPTRWTSAVAGYAVVVSIASALVGLPVLVTAQLSHPVAIGRWIADHSSKHDTAFVAYGSAQILQASGLSSPYPYAWSLPLRVNDPKLTLLTSTMAGPSAPTWIVQSGSFDWWHIETPAFQHVLASRYHVAARVCGRNVFLLDSADRPVGPHATCPASK